MQVEQERSRVWLFPCMRCAHLENARHSMRSFAHVMQSTLFSKVPIFSEYEGYLHGVKKPPQICEDASTAQRPLKSKKASQIGCFAHPTIHKNCFSS